MAVFLGLEVCEDQIRVTSHEVAVKALLARIL